LGDTAASRFNLAEDTLAYTAPSKTPDGRGPETEGHFSLENCCDRYSLKD
jgi:hypothetical protein